MVNRSEKVLDFLRRQQSEMLSLLQKLVAMETPTDVAESQQPILDCLQAELRKLDFLTLRTPPRQFGGNLYARLRNSRHARYRQLLLGHCDTVWPIGTLKDMPLEFNASGKILRGPGVYDMKAGLVEMIYALKALRALELHPQVTPLVFINSDEELGSRESGRYIRRLARCCDRALVMEPSLGPLGKLKTGRKGVGRFSVSVKGKAAHAGLDPSAGASAILELSHVIQKLFALNDPERGASVNVGVIDGGVRANVVAPESNAVVDVRVENQIDADRIQQEILSLKPETPGVVLQISGGIGRPPMEHTPANRQLWTLAKELASDLSLPVEEATAGGGSDGNTTSRYTATLDGLGAVGDGAHAANEHIEVEQLPLRCALLTLMLLAPPLEKEAI